MVEQKTAGEPRAVRGVEEPLASRRASGDAGHVPGCRRDHALHVCVAADTAASHDPHEAALRQVQDARAALPDVLRQAYALDEGQVATVLRVADALAAGVSLEAREVLGREVTALFRANFGCNEAGARLFALGRASVVPPDADLARVIAAWPALTPFERESYVRNVETIARRHWRDVAEAVLSPDGCAAVDRVRVSLSWSLFAGMRVGAVEVWAAVEPRTPTLEEWARLRAAGVPVADGVGV